MKHLKSYNENTKSNLYEELKNLHIKKFTKVSKKDYLHTISNIGIFEEGELYPASYDDRNYQGQYGKYWGFHASYFGIFHILQSIKYILPNKNPKLVDVGCGVGNVLSMCDLMGYSCMGIEYNENLKKFQIFINIIYGDVFNNIGVFKNVDLVYLYQPFYTDVLETKFLNDLYNNTKDDVIVVYTHMNEKHKKWETLSSFCIDNDNDVYTNILMKKMI
jgi:hypothetical protein